MAKAYFEKLCQLVEDLTIEKEVTADLKVKHFFSGAALYANNAICASWSPVGLAFKLAEAEATKLIGEGVAKPLRYFDKGNAKRGYVLFENPETEPSIAWKKYLFMSIKQTQNERTS